MRFINASVILIFSLLMCSCTSLIMSAGNGDVEGVRKALAKGFPIDFRDQNGNTPLILAAGYGYADVVECLCFHGANVNARAYNGVTALHHAAYYNLLDVAKVLIKYKADKTIHDQYGNTPLDYANQYEYLRMIALLSDERPKYMINTQFASQEWRFSEGIGHCGIIGQASMRAENGETKTCVNQNVYLMPLNDYTKEIFEAKKSGKFNGFSNTDPRLRRYIRETVCDDDGIFMFSNLPNGNWIISTRVEWQVAVGSYKEKHGGQLMKPIVIKSSDTGKIVMTADDRVF